MQNARTFHPFQNLPDELKCRIIAFAYEDILPSSRSLQGNGPVFSLSIDIDMQRAQTDQESKTDIFITLEYEDGWILEQGQTKWSIYFVNGFFRTELDRLSAGRLFFVLQPDFTRSTHSNTVSAHKNPVVWFDPAEMTLIWDIKGSTDDITHARTTISKKLASCVRSARVSFDHRDADEAPLQDEEYDEWMERVFEKSRGQKVFSCSLLGDVTTCYFWDD